jgi:outer membrane protein insertion porin family
MKRRALFLRAVFVLIVPISVAALTFPQANSHQRDEEVYYRFGKITVDSANVFAPEQVMRIAGIKSNAFASPSVIEPAANVIKRAYLNRGYLRAEVMVDADYQLISPRTKQGLVEIVIKINEGAVFRTRRLEFVGNATTRDRIIRRRVLLNEGDPYTEELLDKSLRRINDLGRFEKLTRENVMTEIDERENIVDVRIYLREKVH